MNTEKSAVQQFKEAAAELALLRPRLIAGTQKLGEPIKFLGNVLSYEAMSGDGTKLDYNKLITKSPGWTVVAGVTKDNFLLTQANYKAGVDKEEWSFAPGGIGKGLNHDATPEDALSKTQEGFLRETGYGNGEWITLGTVMIHSGMIRGSSPESHGLWVHMYLALGLEHASESKPAVSETIRVLKHRLDQIDEIIESGLFDECSSLACMLLAQRRLRKLGMLS